MAPDTGTVAAAAIDEAYEFSAPRFFDFINEETEEAARAAESRFEAAMQSRPLAIPLRPEPSIKGSRAEAKVAVLCDLTEAEEPALKEEPVEGVAGGVVIGAADAVDGSMQDKKSVVKGGHDLVTGKAASEIVQENLAAKRRRLDDGRAIQEDADLQERPKLMLTRPKEHGLQTYRRVRVVRAKSTAELEEEMLAKIPKFRARPFNKKIAEAPLFPPLPRKTLQEFHIKKMERATRYADTCSEISSADTIRSQSKPLKLTQPKPPQLHTAMQAWPPSVKRYQELELEKAPKFRAKLLNKKILESKGDIGAFAHPKHQVTAPKEFQFSTDVRLGPPSVSDLFDKLSLHSDCSTNSNRQDAPRFTKPNPFNLHAEARGQFKERRREFWLLQKKMKDEKARVHKANPFSYTTDYPVVPPKPKPKPKPCTRPVGFQLESLVLHELVQQRLVEERERLEREGAQRRIIKSQPILKEDPIPLPEKERKPLTEVNNLHCMLMR